MQWRSTTSVNLRRGTALMRLVLVAALALPTGACSSFSNFPSFSNLFAKDEAVAPDEPPEKLYNEGVFLLDRKQEYKEAAKKFSEVERQHPYSDWARKSLLTSAYANYEAKEYDESVSAARRYVTLHPGSPDAAYAQFLIGSAYYERIPDVTRDQGQTEKAIAALEEVTRKYPDSEYAQNAKSEERRVGKECRSR